MDDETPTEDELRPGDCVRFVRDQPQTIGDGTKAAMARGEMCSSPAWAALAGDRVVMFGTPRVSTFGGSLQENGHE